MQISSLEKTLTLRKMSYFFIFSQIESIIISQKRIFFCAFVTVQILFNATQTVKLNYIHIYIYIKKVQSSR